MRYAVVNDGIVSNVILWDGESPIDENLVLIPSDQPFEIGWKYDGENFTPPEEIPIVPDEVSSRQFETQLYRSGILTMVEQWINNHPNPEIKISYQKSRSFLRADPMMQAGFNDLGFNEEMINQFFIDASKI